MYLQIQLIKLYYDDDDVSTSLSLSPVRDRSPLDAQDLSDAENTLMMMLQRQRMGDGEEHEEEDASTPSSEGEENQDFGIMYYYLSSNSL